MTGGMVTFSTGAVRSSDRENERYDLISPIGMRRLSETCHEGSQRYGDYNWERGMPVSEMLNHAISHLYAYLSGDRSEDHLAHAAWNCCGAMHSEELWPHLNKNLRWSGCCPPHKTDEPVSFVTPQEANKYFGQTIDPWVPTDDETDAYFSVDTITCKTNDTDGKYVQIDNPPYGQLAYTPSPKKETIAE